MTRLSVVAPALIALLARLLTGPHPIDDAYITFRYARNLAEGAGLVYNAGDWVLGTTAPLWAVILACGAAVGLTDLTWLATVISALCDAASVMLIASLALRMGWPPLGAGLVGLAWALNPTSIAFATGGMETSLFVLASLSCLTLAATRRHLIVAAALAGLAMFVRPEGALLAAAVVGWTFMVRRRALLMTALAAALPLALGGIVLLMEYGSPLPHSMAAKQAAYVPTAPYMNAVTLLVQAGLPGWSPFLLPGLLGPEAPLLLAFGLSTLIFLLRAGIKTLIKADLAWQPFVAFATLYIAFYVVVGLRGVRLFPWYLVPIEPFYLLGAAAGLLKLGRRRWSAWMAFALVAWQLPAIDWHQPLLPTGDDLRREHLLLDIGSGLATSLPPDAVIAAPEIGALGYASRLRVLDTIGLVSPVAVRYYPLPPESIVADNAIPPRLIADQQPDVVVSLEEFAQRSVMVDPEFLREYRLEQTYPIAIWKSEAIVLFRRVDLVAKH